MKKIILTAAAVFAISFANAQEAKFGFVKGDVTLTGNVTTETDKATIISPSLAYFVSDKFSIDAGFSSESGGAGDSSTSFNAGINYRVLELGQRFKVFAAAGIGLGDKVTTFDIDANLNYFLTQKLSIGLNIANFLNYTKVDGVDGGTTKINLNKFENIFNVASYSLTYRF
jgi:hypothetical protein